jgi:hypothetical protein
MHDFVQVPVQRLGMSHYKNAISESQQVFFANYSTYYFIKFTKQDQINLSPKIIGKFDIISGT